MSKQDSFFVCLLCFENVAACSRSLMHYAGDGSGWLQQIMAVDGDELMVRSL
jgi:hypothetical protein